MTDRARSTPYVGQPLRRREDIKFITGNGRYVDDIKLPGMLHLAILRSPHAHARITGVELSAARAATGVRLALAGADLTGKIANIKPDWIVPGTVVPDRPVMAVDRVRFVGECVALVVAETREGAYDALKRIDVAYEVLPAVIDVEVAIGDGAPQLHDNVPRHTTTYFKIGGGDYAAAARQADQVLRLRLANNRLIPTCLETRAILVEPSVDGRLTIYLPSQVPDMHRRWIAETVGIPEHICCAWLRRISAEALGQKCTSTPKSCSAPIWPAS
jgi:aerobic carbon-monoxide dehydrogenase large subunit